MEIIIGSSLFGAGRIGFLNYFLDLTYDYFNVVKFNLDTRYFPFENPIHLLDHSHGWECLFDLVDRDYELFIELGGFQRWALLNVKLLLEILFEVSLELRWTHLVNLFWCLRKVLGIR